MSVNVSVYFSSDAEIEKLQMQLDMKDKELALQQREIVYLKGLNELLKKQSTQTE